MKKWLILIVMLLATFLQTPTTKAYEEKRAFWIQNSSYAELLQILKVNNIEISEKLDSIEAVRIWLTKDEKATLQSALPASNIQLDKMYKQSADVTPSNLQRINATPTQTSQYTGFGVKVAIIDTGIDTEHPDLDVAGGICTMDTDCSFGIPYDDNNGHGTHVAGIIAAQENDKGIIGIAPDATIYSVKVLNEGGVGSTSSIIRGIDWAIKQNVDIINFSLSTSSDDDILRSAIQKAYDAGILLVAAAGNEGNEGANNVSYPGKYESVFAVGAINSSDQKLAISSTGPEVEFAAPGAGIYSTYPIEWDMDDDSEDGYTRLSGTSMAAPHVVGILALYKERFPTMSSVDLRYLAREFADDIGEVGRDTQFGFGVVQYPTVIEGAPTLTQQTMTGKVELTPTGQNDAFQLFIGEQLLSQTNGKYHFYGVKGIYNVYTTYKSTFGMEITERDYAIISNPYFPDVTPTQWFSEHIGFLASNSQVSGFDDGTFRPYKQISRAEAAILIGRALNLPGGNVVTNFSDVAPSSIASGYIQQAVEKGIISGFSDGTFRPGKLVSRGEMAILLARAYNLTYEAGTVNTFKDVVPSMASYNYILPIAKAGVTTGYTDRTFRPSNIMTRAEFSVFLARIQAEDL